MGMARNDGWDHDDVTFFPFLEVSKKYKSDQNYVYNFSFPKMDDDLEGVKNPEI
jgi:hypothetical protein